MSSRDNLTLFVVSSFLMVQVTRGNKSVNNFGCFFHQFSPKLLFGTRCGTLRSLQVCASTHENFMDQVRPWASFLNPLEPCQ